MSLADEIRQHALQHYVEPARSTHQPTVTIRAGDICRNLGLRGRTPSVCSALESSAFLSLGGLKLLERTGPRQSTTTRFRYAIGQASPDAAKTSSAEPGATDTPHETWAQPVPTAPSHRGRDDFTVVIQCAATKQPEAGHLIGEDGNPILFVARPDRAPKTKDILYQRPDDLALDGRTWRAHLLDYNRRSHNPLGILPAWQLYRPPVYGELADAFGLENLFILSAGWGLLAAGFLTPQYDITFTNQADIHKRRSRRDRFADFRMPPDDREQPVVFLGGRDYVGLFRALTRGSAGKRIVFYNSANAPDVTDCRCVRFKTTTRTNWHYECARALIDGTLDLPL